MNFAEELNKINVEGTKKHKVPKQMIVKAKDESIRTTIDLPIKLRKKIDLQRAKTRLKFRDFCILAFEEYLNSK